MEIKEIVRAEINLIDSSAFVIKEIGQILCLMGSGHVDGKHFVTKPVFFDLVNIPL